MGSSTNRSVGTGFERELCDFFADRGWWAHNMAQNQVGQPADVIVVKNNFAVLIDCKVCENNRFPFSRVEPNQEGAMTLWEERNNEYCYFALKLKDGSMYMLSFDRICRFQLEGKNSLNENEIRKLFPLSMWADWMERKVCR